MPKYTMITTIILIIVTMSFLAASQIFYKKGMPEPLNFSGIKSLYQIFKTLIMNKYIILGLLCSAVGAFAWIFFVIPNGNLSYIFPIAAGIFYILLFSAAHIFLKDMINLTSAVGIALIVVGVAVASFK